MTLYTIDKAKDWSSTGGNKLWLIHAHHSVYSYIFNVIFFNILYILLYSLLYLMQFKITTILIYGTFQNQWQRYILNSYNI